MNEIDNEVLEADKKLNAKVLEKFAKAVVRKDLAFQVKGNLPVPTYVIEYLLAQYCQSSDEAVIAEGMEKVKEIVRDHYFNRADNEIIKGRIREKGSYLIIDKVSAYLDAGSNCYRCNFENLGLGGLNMPDQHVRANEKLLSGTGVWSIVRLRFDPSDDAPSRWVIEMYKPIQVANIDLEEYKTHRGEFTTDEWIDFLIHSIGLNPCVLNRREKLIAIARLLPYIENNYNFMELGPKGTGKSHVFQDFSPYGVLVSGGDVTSARLFVKISGRQEILGLVGYWDNVAWDEFEQQKGRATDAVLIDTMQNYLANKAFNRGGATHVASASMCFVGNTKHTVEYMMRRTHLFESIPTSFIKGAFLDRIHLYNPGWEISPLKKSSFSGGYGMITDYFAAILHAMRKEDRSGEMLSRVKFSGTLSERDHLAIRKTFSGMMKLLYPDGKFTEAEALEVINFAAEGRKRVKEQLYRIDETFKAEPAVFEYEVLQSGEKCQITTLEEIENGPVCAVGSGDGVEASAMQGGNGSAGIPCSPSGEAAGAAVAGRPSCHRDDSVTAAMPALGPKHVYVQSNQRGVSYRSLFGDYLRGAQEIVIVDPFIYKPYQLDNLGDLLQLILDMNDDSEEDLRVELHTRISETDPQVQNEAFESFKEDMAREGVEFDFTYDATHDRVILVDDRWAINLGRGLDIFDYFQRYSLKRASQRMRKCRDFQMTIAPIQPTVSTEDLIAGIKSGKIKSKSTDGYLVLAGEFYDKIESGEKKIEYRDFTAYNLKRTIGITSIRFNRGYVKNAPQMRWEVQKVVLMDENDHECDPFDVPEGFCPTTIAVHLGQRLG